MPKRLSCAVPLNAYLLTFGAFALPWRPLILGQPPDPHSPLDVALAGLAAAVGLAYLGAIRWRDLERIGEAWAVTTRIGEQSLPADRLRAWAGWGLDVLHRERFWGRGLEISARSLRRLVAGLSVLTLLAALAGLALVLARTLAPELGAPLPLEPGWSDVLSLALPAALWPVAARHLAELPHGGVPSEAQIGRAHLDLVGRLTDPRLQAGAAAMSAVDRGLDGVLALAGALAPPRPTVPAIDPARPGTSTLRLSLTPTGA